MVAFLDKYQHLRGLHSSQYKLVSVTPEGLFTRILVKLPGPQKQADIKPYLIKELFSLAEMYNDTAMERDIGAFFKITNP